MAIGAARDWYSASGVVPAAAARRSKRGPQRRTVHGAGEHGIDADAIGTDFAGEHLRGGEQRRLRRRVGRPGRAGPAGHPGCRRRRSTHRRAGAAPPARRGPSWSEPATVTPNTPFHPVEIGLLDRLVEWADGEGVGDHAVEAVGVSTASATRRAQSPSSVMSQRPYAARPPAASISAATSARYGSVRAPMTTAAPSAAARTAIWRPRPAPTPATITTLPASSPSPTPPAAFVSPTVRHERTPVVVPSSHWAPDDPRERLAVVVDHVFERRHHVEPDRQAGAVAVARVPAGHEQVVLFVQPGGDDDVRRHEPGHERVAVDDP